ncbi:hypothetical protein NKR19_g5419 [Coniochaeta hoffmannii]|uniref:Uncharacterized protein n=1 Tax=Coniochaeta hoffmannii TaxID=91930 RepID=A0AA38VGJ5_9PEZI|nr:hypothetical protein NKR19_g5419 [Coniochaeta hoffmannii]
MHFPLLLQFIAASGLALAPVLAAPTEELKGHTALEKRTVFRGYCNVDQNACHWSASDGSRVGTCTCSTGNECRINNGLCYYDDQTLSCICPNGSKQLEA